MFAASKSPAGNNYGPADAQFDYVTLLLNGDGTNGAQNNTFLDSSSNNFTITRNGNTTQGSFSPYGNLWSNYFNGSTDWFTTASNAAFAFGTGNFTMEAWIFPTASQTDNWIIGLANNCWLRIGSAGKLEFYDNVATTGTLSASAVSLNVWSHVAAVRSGTTLTLYINGSSVATSTVSSNFSTSVACTIGNQSGQPRYWNGYISNARVVKGTAVYTSAFTPSITPLTAITNTQLLTCQSNRFIDNSSNAFAITVNGTPSVQRFSPFNPTAPYSTATIGGSGYFDGSTAFLNTASLSNFALGTSDFTLEGYVYPTASQTDNWIIACQLNCWLRVGSSGKLSFYDGIGASEVLASSALPLNMWSHVAAVRSGTTLTLYQNGVSVGSGTVSTNFVLSVQGSVGGVTGFSRYWNGYISDARIVKGTAVYTGSTYTIPTSPISSIANTQLLCNMTNAGIPDLAMMNDLQTVGNAQVNTSVKKFGTGSLYFDGNGDDLYVPYTNENFNLGTGNFTVEGWIYPTALSGYKVLVGTYASTDTSLIGWLLQLNGTSLRFYSAVAGIDNSSGTLSTNTWQHIAATRSGNTFYIFINGTQTATFTSSSSLSSNQGLVVGARQPDQVDAYSGYIDDLRITKGYARYTSSFTPPTAALPTY